MIKYRSMFSDEWKVDDSILKISSILLKEDNLHENKIKQN